MNTMLTLVRREFWEHRSLWMAPLIWVGIIVVLFTWTILVGDADINGHKLADVPGVEQGTDLEAHKNQALREAASIPESRKQTANTISYLVFAAFISVFATIVVFFYLIDCLFTERRDRSILFWKSLPVSDTQVVLSKLVTAMVVVPAGVIVLSSATQFVMYCIVWLKFHGTLIGEVIPGWDIVTWLRTQFVAIGIMLGGLLWYMPIAAYFLLLSAWARRLVFLWAVVPLIAIPPLEYVFFHSNNFAQFLSYRFFGFIQKLHLDKNTVQSVDGKESLPQVDDLFRAFDLSGVFTSVDMWLGLLAAAAMVYATIRIRRYRDES